MPLRAQPAPRSHVSVSLDTQSSSAPVRSAEIERFNGLCTGGAVARLAPKLALTVPTRSNGTLALLPRTASAIAIAASMRVSLKRMLNFSPPKRAAPSELRSNSRTRSAVSLSSTSPLSWPNVSLFHLNKLRSKLTTDKPDLLTRDAAIADSSRSKSVVD